MNADIQKIIAEITGQEIDLSRCKNLQEICLTLSQYRVFLDGVPEDTIYEDELYLIVGLDNLNDWVVSYCKFDDFKATPEYIFEVS